MCLAICQFLRTLSLPRFTRLASPRQSRARAIVAQHLLEQLEARQLLTDLRVVPIWNAEAQDADDSTLNLYGGPVVTGSGVTVVRDTLGAPHGGTASYRMNLNSTVVAGDFRFFQTAFAGIPAPVQGTSYDSTRDISHFSALRFAIRNSTNAAFTLTTELKDYQDSNAQRRQFSTVVSPSSAWQEIQISFNNPAWVQTGTPDLSRGKSLSFVVKADQGSSLTGSLSFDDVAFVEPGAPIDPLTAPFSQIATHQFDEKFAAIFGARDRATGFIGQSSAYADVAATNSTAAAVWALPSAFSHSLVTSQTANAWLTTVLTTTNELMDSSKYLLPRYFDFITLEAKLNEQGLREESVVDTALMVTALERNLHSTFISPANAQLITQTLSRFDFTPFASGTGWHHGWVAQPGVPDNGSILPAVYNGTTEAYVICLAADLMGQVPITQEWFTVTSRVATRFSTASPAYLVHSQTQFRSPFTEYLFTLFASTTGRAKDTNPNAALRNNPQDNFRAYQRDVLGELAARGRTNFVQPDAADDGSNNNYVEGSLWNDEGQSSLSSPWSAVAALDADPMRASAAIRFLLNANLYGPFGMSDSVHWTTGAASPTQIAARQDLWNAGIELMAWDSYANGANQSFASQTVVRQALDKVLAPLATVTNVSSTNVNGAYKAGTVIDVTVTFTKPVVVTGSPQLRLETGATDRTASYLSGSGSNSLKFRYTVQAGDTSRDLNYTSTTALFLNGGTIRDSAANGAALTLPALGAAGSLGVNKNLIVDTVGPQVTSVASTKANGAYKAGVTLDITVAFNEAVLVTGSPQVRLETGTTDRTASYLSGSGSDTLKFRYTVQAGDKSSDLNYTSTTALFLNGGSIRDPALNSATLTLPALGAAGSLAVNKALVIDTTGPAVTNVTSTKANGRYGAGTVIDVTVTFNEAVLVTGTPQIRLETGTTDRTANYLSGTGSSTLTFRYVVQAGDRSGDLNYTSVNALFLNGGTIRDLALNTATLTLPATGGNGSLGVNKNLVIDTAAPAPAFDDQDEGEMETATVGELDEQFRTFRWI